SWCVMAIWMCRPGRALASNWTRTHWPTRLTMIGATENCTTRMMGRWWIGEREPATSAVLIGQTIEATRPISPVAILFGLVAALLLGVALVVGNLHWAIAAV